MPGLVAAGAHTAAAGALLGRLAEAHRQGPGPEAALRVPVLAALGALRIDPALAEKVLGAALEARGRAPPATRPLRLNGGAGACRSGSS